MIAQQKRGSIPRRTWSSTFYIDLYFNAMAWPLGVWGDKIDEKIMGVVPNLQRSRGRGQNMYIYAPHFYSPGHTPASMYSRPAPMDTPTSSQICTQSTSFQLT